MSDNKIKNIFFSAQKNDEERDTYLNIAKGKENWRRIAFIIGLYAFLATGALVVRSFQAKYKPYIVKVNELDKAVAFGPAESLKKGDSRLIRAQLYQWLEHIRSVNGDEQFITRQMNKAFAMLSGKVSKQLNEYFSVTNHDPRNLIKKYRRGITIRSIIPVNKKQHRWKLQWIETLYPKRSGKAISRQEWECYITLMQKTPTTSDGILKNPLGLYITSLSWQPTSPKQHS